MILIIFSILGTIYFGIATPTEAAGVGCFVVLILAFTMYNMRLKALYRALVEAANGDGELLDGAERAFADRPMPANVVRVYRLGSAPLVRFALAALCGSFPGNLAEPVFVCRFA